MHGNVAEWVLDSYVPDAYGKRDGLPTKSPLVIIPGAPHIVRGGSWNDPDSLRSAARRASTPPGTVRILKTLKASGT